MSLLHAHLAPAVDAIYAMDGVNAIYSSREHGSCACVVLVDHDVSQYGGTAAIVGKTVLVSVRVGDVRSMPRRDDLFDIEYGKYAGRRLTVTSVVESDEFEHKVLAA